MRRASISPTTPLRVVVIAPDVVAQAQLVRILEAERDIRAVAVGRPGREGVALISSHTAELVVIDAEDETGAAAATIRDIVEREGKPVLAVAAPSRNGHSPCAVEALAAGAADALPLAQRANSPGAALIRARARTLRGVTLHPPAPRRAPPAPVSGRPLVVIAASTGGPVALERVLVGLGDLPAPVLVVQHLHEDFVDGLITWLATRSALPVELAAQAVSPRPGRVYVAGGDRHLRVRADGRLELDRMPEHLHRPSADELFFSAARHSGSAAVGVLLTGMGDDGARGLLALREAGAETIAQDEETCAVFGMPRVAIQLGAARHVLPLDAIAGAVRAGVRSRTR